MAGAYFNILKLSTFLVLRRDHFRHLTCILYLFLSKVLKLCDLCVLCG